MAYNSTITTKKRKLSCGCFDYAFSKNMCKTHATILSTKKRMDKAAEREEEDGLPELIKELDSVFSQYIRLKDADANGMVTCFTSGKIMHYKEAHAGHFVSRGNLFLRWDTRNVHVQSPEENVLKYGNIPVYGRKLDELQPGLSEILMEEANVIYKPTHEELRQQISNYRNKVNNLLKQLKQTTV